MTTKKNLVKTMFMNILTAGVFTVAFTACSDDLTDSNAMNGNEANIAANNNEKLLEPLGLVYTDFINDNDVTIQNADTTEISVSKAYADKMGVSNFVNHPMGIWDKKDNAAYLRRATEQRLEGDRYILKVKRSSIAEVTGGRDLILNTGLYYNPGAAATRAAATGMPEDVAKYIDANNVIHPAAITINSLPGEDVSTRGAINNYGTYTVEEIFNGQIGGDTRWGLFSWIKEKVETIAREVKDFTTYTIDADKQTFPILHEKMELERKWKVECGPGENDTLNINVDCPLEFSLDYTLELHAKGDITTAMIPRLSNMETYFDGYFGMNPKMTLGFSNALTLPKDKQKIKLYSFTGIGVTFFIGIVPVHIDFDPNIYLKLTASLEGKSYVGFDYQFGAKFRTGIKYNNGNWGGICEGGIVKNDFNFIRPTAEIEAKAGIGLMLGVDVIIDKIAGPSASVGPQLNAKANLTIAPWSKEMVNFKANVTAGCSGEVGGKIKVFGYELADWKWPFEIGPQKTIYQYPAADK